MTRYSLSDIPAQVPETDVQLILQANDQPWEMIDEDAAVSAEGRAILHDIASTKYHRDEYRCGME